MEFRGTILFDASPALLGAINRVADVFAGQQVVYPPLRVAPDTTGAIVTTLKVREPLEVQQPVVGAPGKAEPVVEVTATAAAPVEAPAVTAPPAGTKLTMEQVRAAAALKKDKRDEMKKILDAMGVPSIPKLPEDKFEEFMQQISLL